MTQDKPKIKISCILLSCDSHINKGNSVLACLYPLFNQKFDSAEIIIVENSHDKKNLKKLISEIQKINKLIDHKFSFKILNNKKSLSRGEARNIGVKNSRGDIIIFIDDDTIILDNQAFSKIFLLSKKYKYGFGANRLWIRNTSSNNKNILKNVKNASYDNIRKRLFLPSNKRAGFNAEVLTKTFIGNFGFCNKDFFLKVGGFHNFINYGFEDDHLMYRLFIINKDYALLDNIDVVHVDHVVPIENHRSLIDYFCKLINENVYWFHSYKLFNKNINKNEILEPLKLLHYDYLIQSSYNYYKELNPLDIKNKNINSYLSWVAVNQYSIQEFSRLIDVLINSKNLDEFIKKSCGDFDNLAILIESALKYKLIKINKKGLISKLYSFKFTRPYQLINHKLEKFIPDYKLNQFPCDKFSRKRRFELIKKRYPFAEYLKFAIIGDDDFLSIEFANDYWAWPVIIEKDKRIINQIKKIDKRFEIIEADIGDPLASNNLPSVQTFITDPPYTLNGSLAFIYFGLKMLEKNTKTKEFYVIMNKTMMGSHLYTIEKILSESNIYIKEIVENFSHYELPKNFKELKRAKQFLSSQKIKHNFINLSSSSNLYIFETKNPNILKIKNNIDFNKIYKHYL